jgi:hypothetical protein
VIGSLLRLVWDLVGRPLAVRHGVVEPTADDFVLAGWGAERAGRAEDALAAYDEALRHRPWDEETTARRAGLIRRCPYLADRAEQSEWERLATLDPVEVLNLLGAQASDRKLLLVVAAFYQRAEHQPIAHLDRAIVDALEECADGRVPAAVLRRQIAARTARSEAESPLDTDAHFDLVTAPLLLSRPRLWAEVSLRTVAPTIEAAEQVRLLGCILGPLHRVRAADPAWLTSTVVALARQMYESGDFSGMPILADALQDAGCEDAPILSHCRGPGPHARGCWVVDLVLGKS